MQTCADLFFLFRGRLGLGREAVGDAGPVGWLDLAGARGEDAEIGEEGVEEGRGGE